LLTFYRHLIMNVFISHTTTDNRDFALAHKLAAGLRSADVKAWIAPESIPAGDLWEEALVNAVMNQCTHFLLILSEASMQSTWVQKEISMALERSGSGMLIFQLKMGKPSTYGKGGIWQSLDKFQALPYQELFSAQLNALLSALDLPPVIPAMFRTLIAESTKYFTGREHVFAAISTFLRDTKKGYFTLIGDPGEGKTTILAEYVRRTGSPAHFNIALEGVNSGEQFFESLKTQLGARYDVVPSDRAGERPSPAMQIIDLLEKAAAAIPSGERLVIVVDALDEARQNEGDGLANILGLPSILPEGVFMLVSRRPKEVALNIRERQLEYNLLQTPRESRQDIEAYLRKRLGEATIAAWMVTRELTIEKAVAELADRSENNFMYLYHVLLDISAGGFAGPDDPLPTGLSEYYMYHWRKLGMDRLPVAQLKLDVLYILSLLREPLSVRLLAEITGAPRPDVRTIIEAWKEFLHPVSKNGETRYRLYHSSFQEFLHSKEMIQEDVDTSRYNELIVKYFSSKISL